MGGGGGGGFWEDTWSSVSDGLADFEDNGLDTAAAYFTNPLLAQDIAGSSLASGEGSSAWTAAPGELLTNPEDYLADDRNALELAQFNASLLAGAAGGAMFAPAAGLSELGGLTAAQWAAQGVAMPGAAAAGAGYAAAAGGVAAGGLTQAGGNAIGTGAMDQAVQDAQDAANADRQAAADNAAARASAILALPKNPTVDEIQRQRQRRGGRRGTILTTPGQSLGSTGQGKTLLGL